MKCSYCGIISEINHMYHLQGFSEFYSESNESRDRQGPKPEYQYKKQTNPKVKLVKSSGSSKADSKYTRKHLEHWWQITENNGTKTREVTQRAGREVLYLKIQNTQGRLTRRRWNTANHKRWDGKMNTLPIMRNLKRWPKSYNYFAYHFHHVSIYCKDSPGVWISDCQKIICSATVWYFMTLFMTFYEVLKYQRTEFLFPMDAPADDLQEISVVQNWRLSQPLDRDVFSETEWSEMYRGSCSDRDDIKCLTGEMKFAWIIWKNIAKPCDGWKGVL